MDFFGSSKEVADIDLGWPYITQQNFSTKYVFDVALAVAVGCSPATPGGYNRYPSVAERDFPKYGGNSSSKRKVHQRVRFIV